MRILLLTSKPPLPGRLTGGGQRTDLLMRALERCGTLEVVLAGPQGLYSDTDLDALRRRWQLLGFHPWRSDLWAGPWRPLAAHLGGSAGRIAAALAYQSGSYRVDQPFADWLGTITDLRSYDVVVVRYLAPLLRSGLLAAGVPVVLDVDDLDSEVLCQQIRSGASRVSPLLGRWLLWRLRAIEARAFRACAHLWLSNSADQRRLALPHTTVLPNVPWCAEGRRAAPPSPDIGSGHRVLFVGDMSYLPNSDGISAFLDQAWPVILQRVPDARLRLVGPPPPPDLRTLWSRSSGVEICGYVKDLTPVYSAAALTIAPIVWGGGTCIKVLESLAHGRPCVLTERARQGHADFLHHGDALWCAHDVAGMAEGCIQLLQNAALRRAMGARGWRLISQHATPTIVERIVQRTLTAI